ncbi:MAG: hypothetical protein V7641_4928 [Blastocatellia bacterium]
MARQASIYNVEALEALDAALARFSANAEEALMAVRPEIDRGLDLLEERRVYWARQVQNWQNEYDSADPEEDDLGYIANQLEEAEEALHNVKRWLNAVEESVHAYARQQRRLNEVALARLDEARAFLRHKVAQLYAYAAGQINPATAGHAPTATAALGMPAASQAPLVDLTQSPLPAGFRWISLAEISPAEMSTLPAANEFSKVSYDEVKRGFEVLKDEVLPAIKRDPANASVDYFGQTDRQTGRDEVNGAQRVFHAFFSQIGEHIYLDKRAGDPYFSITNGRHRLKVARDLGWTAVPAKAVEVQSS